MTARFTTDPPLASANTWAGRPAPYSQIEAAWRGNAGPPGSQAENIVLDCLCALQKIPEMDRLFADELMDKIAAIFLSAATDGKTEVRRAHALRRIAQMGNAP